jgi:hypothetical protein
VIVLFALAWKGSDIESKFWMGLFLKFKIKKVQKNKKKSHNAYTNGSKFPNYFPRFT